MFLKMPLRVCFWCCLHDNRIHPLENMINFSELVIEEECTETLHAEQEEGVDNVVLTRTGKVISLIWKNGRLH